jgi:hypothetical protein
MKLGAAERIAKIEQEQMDASEEELKSLREVRA